MILALETSCDDTCAAVLDRDGVIAANVISSQGIHDRYGGVVPEVASRHHLELVNAAVDDALARAGVGLDDVDLVAVTQGPGLVAALLVGVATAKGLAAARELPLAPVDHLHGHVAANFVRGLTPEYPGTEGSDPSGSGTEGSDPPGSGTEGSDPPGSDPFEPPFLCLIASGGHTLLTRVEEPHGFTTLGQTLDDAAGEAFDKGARLLGLGFPGGPALQRLAEGGDPDAFAFPTARNVEGLDFSFAGLKTALLYAVRDLGEQEAERRRPDLAASYQRAIVAQLVDRIERGLEHTGLDRLALGGGVAANGPLREAVAALAPRLHLPPMALCTDNAAMIASAARFVVPLPYPDYLALDAYATGERAP